MEVGERHPEDTRLIRGHPGGGLYDLLWITQPEGTGEIMLNRNGSIHVRGRFDGRVEITWRDGGWDHYLRSDPHMNSSRGLSPPPAFPRHRPCRRQHRALSRIAFSQRLHRLRSCRCIQSRSKRATSTAPVVAARTGYWSDFQSMSDHCVRPTSISSAKPATASGSSFETANRSSRLINQPQPRGPGQTPRPSMSRPCTADPVATLSPARHGARSVTRLRPRPLTAAAHLASSTEPSHEVGTIGVVTIIVLKVRC